MTLKETASLSKKSIRAYLLRGGAWAVAGKVLSSFSGLAFLGLLARLLRPEEMGLYFLLLNIATFFAIFGRGGMENTFLRFIAQANSSGQWQRLRELLSKGSVIVAAQILLSALVLGICLPWLGQAVFDSSELSRLSLVGALWAGLLALEMIVAEVFRGFQDIGGAVWFGGLCSSLLRVLFLGGVAVSGQSANFVMILGLILISSVINSSWAVIVLYRRWQNLPPAKDREVSYGELLDHSWPLLVNAVVIYLLTHSDIWILGAFGSKDDLAIYGAASKLVMLTSMSLSIVNTVIPPLIAQLHAEKDIPRLQRLLQTVATLSGIPTFIILLIFIFGARPIMEVTYGSFYGTGSLALIILSIGQVVNVWVGSCGYVLIMSGYRKTIMQISVCTSLTALLSGVTLVRYYGFIGVAIAYSMSMILQQLGMWIMAKLKCNLWTHCSFKAFSQP